MINEVGVNIPCQFYILTENQGSSRNYIPITAGNYSILEINHGVIFVVKFYCCSCQKLQELGLINQHTINGD